MGQIFRITTTCLVDGQTCQNVFHLDDQIGNGVELNIANTIEVSWLTKITPFQHSAAQWISIEVRKVAPPGLAPFKKIIAVFGSGPAEQDQDNSMLCRMLAFRTNTAGRHGRGFLFIPGTSNQAWSKGLVKPASLTAGAPIITQLKGLFLKPNPGSGLALVISRKSAPGTVVDVTDILQDPVIRSISRRRIGKGI